MNPAPVSSCQLTIEDTLRQVRVSLLRTLAARFPGTPRTLAFGTAIQQQANLDTLLRWYEAVAVAPSLDDVGKSIPTEEVRTRGTGAPDAANSWLHRSFFEQQAMVEPDLLLPYAGQHIAWSWDGSQIVAGDPNLDNLYRKLETAGIDTQRVVFDYVEERSSF